MAIDGNLRLTLVGFSVAFAILAGLFWVVGTGEIQQALAPVDPGILALIAMIAALWLLSWAMALQTVLRGLGVELPILIAVLLWATAQFTNNVTPFGQAGGEPVTALFISRVADTEYETGLAAIASVDALNFIPSIVFASIGLTYYATRFTLGERLSQAALVIAALAVVIPVGAYLVWQNRRRLERVIAAILTPIAQILGRLLPRRPAPAKTAIRSSIRGFFHDIGRVGADRKRLALAIGFSAVGWLGLTISLWLSLYALGHSVPFPAMLIVIPVGAVASITPLPGGLGGIEAVIIVLLVATTPVTAAVASAGVIIHRTATYWLPIVVGGGAAATLGARLRAAGT